MTDQFIKERLYLKGVSPKTIAWYKDSFKAFNGALDNKSTILTRIAELRDKGVKPVSVNTWLRCINAYFRWLHVEHGKPLVKIPKLKEEQKILATLSDLQIGSLVKFVPGKSSNLRRAHLIALTILDCGVRISEVLSLRKEDIDLEALTVRVFGKGGKQRLIPISKELRARLYRYISHNKHQYLFPTRTGGKVSVRNIERDFKSLFKKADIEGVRASPHTIRHTFAVCYLRNGGNLEFLRRCLGHSSLITSQKYLRSLGVEDLGAVHSQLSPLSRH